MRLSLAPISLVLILMFVVPARSAEPTQQAKKLLGADAVLEALHRKLDRQAEDDSPQKKYLKDASAFAKDAGTMPGEKAATAWLALLDRSSSENQLLPLPPPQAWQQISRQLDKRELPAGRQLIRHQGARLLLALLQDDRKAAKKHLEEMSPELEKLDDYELQNLTNVVREIMRHIHTRGQDKQTLAQDFEKRLKQLEAIPGSRDYPESLIVPDLVTIAGKQKAEDLLGRVLVLKQVELDFSNGKDTIELAKSVALKRIEDLPKPHWMLVNSIDSVELYEAFEKKFLAPQKKAAKPDGEERPAAGGLQAGLKQLKAILQGAELGGLHDTYGHDLNPSLDFAHAQAFSYYVVGLIYRGKNKQARDLILENSVAQLDIGEILSGMRRAGLRQSVYKFLDELLAERPELDLWSQYITLAAEINKTDEMLTKVKKAAKNPKLSPLQALKLKASLMEAYLAADKVDEAYATWQEILPVLKEESPSAELVGFVSDRLANTTWLEIGYLLKKPEWVAESGRVISTISDYLDNHRDRENVYYNNSLREEFASVLTAQQRYAEAEALLLEQITETRKLAGDNFGGYFDAEGMLGKLMEIYHKAGRHADVLALADQVKYWRYMDVKLMHSYLEIPLYIATALAETGRKEDALRILDYRLKTFDFENDDYYALYIRLHPEPIALFDQLYKRDQFEERPLLWKGRVLEQQGKLDEAEKVIKSAIAIDPSDGEQGKGDRMRVYAVLRDIKIKQGDKKQAAFLDGVLKAIRLSEDADDYASAGLLTRAVKMYKDSLNHFADAYCIQSRLAIRLNEEGRYEEAEKYYQKAYELMPDSFGRVESHCFGCEGVFASMQARRIAEKVFSRLVRERPDKPQVHYLLGYLRLNQDRYQDALPLFEQAVELDENYINAWLKLVGLSSSIYIAPEKLNRAGLKLLELDPLNRNSSWESIGMVHDFKQLWAVLEKNSALRWKVPEKIYVLKAAQEAKQQAGQALGMWSGNPYAGLGGDGMQFRMSPGVVMQNHPLIDQVYQLIQLQ